MFFNFGGGYFLDKNRLKWYNINMKLGQQLGQQTAVDTKKIIHRLLKISRKLRLLGGKWWSFKVRDQEVACSNHVTPTKRIGRRLPAYSFVGNNFNCIMRSRTKNKTGLPQIVARNLWEEEK